MNKYDGLLSELQNHMFKQQTYEAPIQIPIIPQKPVKKMDRFFFPKGQKDSLFWCFYVMKNGICLYETDLPSFEKEKAEKIKYITILRNSKTILKESHIRKLGDIEINLSLEPKINLNTFFALCALEKLNAFVIQNQVYTEFISDQTKPIYIIFTDKYGFKLEYEPQEVDKINYQTTHFKLPLKSVGTYKLSNLHDICGRLNIIIPSECKKKQDIYNLIVSNINKID